MYILCLRFQTILTHYHLLPSALKKVLCKETATQCKIDFVHGRPYHPQSQGKVERWNGTIQAILGKAMDERGDGKRWYDLLASVVGDYNRSTHATTGGVIPRYFCSLCFALCCSFLTKKYKVVHQCKS
jgi:hypothetical protein